MTKNIDPEKIIREFKRKTRRRIFLKALAAGSPESCEAGLDC